MEPYRIEQLRSELNQLLRKQADVLESRSLGTASDSDLLEYEIRQDVIHEICNELAHSISA
jgi:VanZ family protein